MNKQIVIAGGTFNPIHNGHIMALQALHDSGHFDEIWLMPSGIPPYKEQEKESKNNRLDMCHLIEERLDFVRVCDLEIQSESIAYTYNTWKQLKEIYPKNTFYWMIGDDHVFQIEQWKHSGELLRHVPFALVNRGGYDSDRVDEQCRLLKEKYHTNFFSIAMPKIEVSSTTLRERVKNNQSIFGYTPECIIDYIKQYQLYGGI